MAEVAAFSSSLSLITAHHISVLCNISKPVIVHKLPNFYTLAVLNTNKGDMIKISQLRSI